MRLKKCSLGSETGKLVSWRQNAIWWKFSTESTVTGPKYVLIQIFLDIPTVYDLRQVCTHGFMGKTISAKKFLRL